MTPFKVIDVYLRDKRRKTTYIPVRMHGCQTDISTQHFPKSYCKFLLLHRHIQS